MPSFGQTVFAATVVLSCTIHAEVVADGRLTPASIEFTNGTGRPMSFSVRSVDPRTGPSPWSRYMALPPGQRTHFIRNRCEIHLLYSNPDYSQATFRLGVVDFHRISRLDPNARLAVKIYFIPESNAPQFHLFVFSGGRWMRLDQFLMRQPILDPAAIRRQLADAIRQRNR